METDFSNALLLLVDIQQGLDEPKYGERNNPQAEANIGKLLETWRGEKRPLIHIQHLSTEPNSPLRPELPGVAFKPEAQPLEGEMIIQKNVNSAFIGTDLQERLDEMGIRDLVVIGLTTNHCVSTTTRMAGNLGYNTYIVSDATATFGLIDHKGNWHSADEVHDITLANLQGEFATVVSTDEVVNGRISVKQS